MMVCTHCKNTQSLHIHFLRLPSKAPTVGRRKEQEEEAKDAIDDDHEVIDEKKQEKNDKDSKKEPEKRRGRQRRHMYVIQTIQKVNKIIRKFL